MLFGCYARRHGKSRWGDKTPAHTFYVRQIKAIFPEAKFIHLVRDGRDVAVSLRRQVFGPKSIDSMARKWTKHVLAFHRLKPCMPAGDVLEVHYEALARDPAGVLRGILEFLGEDPVVPDSVQVPETSLKRFYVQYAASHRSLDEPISGSKIGVFREALSRRQLEIFESIAGEALTTYGYPLVTSGYARLRPIESIALRMQDLYGRCRSKFQNPRLIAFDLQRLWRTATVWLGSFLRICVVRLARIEKLGPFRTTQERSDAETRFHKVRG